MGLFSLLTAGVMGASGIDSPVWATCYGVLTLAAGAAAPWVYSRIGPPTHDEGRKILAALTAAFAWWILITAPLTAEFAAEEPPVVIFPVMGLATLTALSAARSRRLAAGLLIGTHVISLSAWLLHFGAGLYRPWVWSFTLFGAMGLAATCPLLVAWAVRSNGGRARYWIAVPLVSVVIALAAFPPVSLDRWANRRFLNDPGLNAFAARASGDGAIRSLWLVDPPRVNEVVVAATPMERDSLRLQWFARDVEVMVDGELLARDGIDRTLYDSFREDLGRYHLVAYKRQGEYLQFKRTYRGCGMVYAPEGARLIDPGDSVPGTKIRVRERIGRWHSCGAF